MGSNAEYARAVALHTDAVQAGAIAKFLETYAKDPQGVAAQVARERGWTPPQVDAYAAKEAPDALRYILRSHGWTEDQVRDYAAVPESLDTVPGAKKSKESASDLGVFNLSSPEQAVKECFRRLRRTVQAPPDASPEVAQSWRDQIRAKLGIIMKPRSDGASNMAMDAYAIAERAAIRTEEADDNPFAE